MVDKTEEMEVEAISLPFELDQILDGLTVENFYLVASTHALKDIDVIVSNVLVPFSAVRILFLEVIGADPWEKIEAVLDLEHLSGGLVIVIFIIHNAVLIFWEHGSVMLSNGEDWLVQGSDALFFLTVRCWPLIKVKWPLENIRVKEIGNLKFLLDELWKILVEEVARRELVLVLDNVFHDGLNSQDLVAFERRIDSRPVEEIAVHCFALLDLIFVNQWVILAEEAFELVLEEVLHWSGIKCQDTGHVCGVELKEWLIEDTWIRLIIYDIYNVTQGLADIEGLEKQ